MSEPWVVFDLKDWGNFWNDEGGLPSDLMHTRTVQIQGFTNQIWTKPYTATYCAFCFTNKVDFTRFTAFCASCYRTLITDKEEHFTKLRNQKRVTKFFTALRKPQRPRKTRPRAIASEESDY